MLSWLPSAHARERPSSHSQELSSSGSGSNSPVPQLTTHFSDTALTSHAHNHIHSSSSSSSSSSPRNNRFLRHSPRRGLVQNGEEPTEPSAATPVLAKLTEPRNGVLLPFNNSPLFKRGKPHKQHHVQLKDAPQLERRDRALPAPLPPVPLPLSARRHSDNTDTASPFSPPLRPRAMSLPGPPSSPHTPRLRVGGRHEDVEQYRSYSPFLPDTLVTRLLLDTVSADKPLQEWHAQERSYECVLLFADISGFSALAERLCSQGAPGIEALSTRLNDYFGQVVSRIISHGGDIVQFAG